MHHELPIFPLPIVLFPAVRERAKRNGRGGAHATIGYPA